MEMFWGGSCQTFCFWPLLGTAVGEIWGGRAVSAKMVISGLVKKSCDGVILLLLVGVSR